MPEFPDAQALLRSLDGLRSVITIFGPDHRLLFTNAHISYLFRSFPPYPTLIGRSYEELIRLKSTAAKSPRRC